jgi:hypothetical protein
MAALLTVGNLPSLVINKPKALGQCIWKNWNFPVLNQVQIKKIKASA